MLADLDIPWSDTYPEEYPRWYIPPNDLLYDPDALEDQQLFVDLFHDIDIMHISLIHEEPKQIVFSIYKVDTEKIDTIDYVSDLPEEQRLDDVTLDLQNLVKRAQKMFKKSSVTTQFLKENPYLMKVIFKGMAPWGINFYKTKPWKSEAQKLLLSCPWHGLRFSPNGPDVPIWNRHFP